jgi:cell wall-associated NlpC family hydrolase
MKKLQLEKISAVLALATVLSFCLAVSHGKNSPRNAVKKIAIDTAAICKDPLNTRNELISYAQKFLGTPYRFAGQDPRGFDCSGYVSYVFKHFKMDLYTSAVWMGKQGRTIELKDAKEGDVIFFTGTNAANRAVGHVGIIISKQGEPTRFIHCSSGRAYCVKYDTLEGSAAYYTTRFLFVKRMIED